MDLNINAEEHFKQIALTKSDGKGPNKTKVDNHDDRVLFITDDHYDYAQFGFQLDYVYDLAKGFLKGISSVCRPSPTNVAPHSVLRFKKKKASHSR
jgi:hypothetical protein